MTIPAPTRQATISEIVIYPALVTPFFLTIPLMVSRLAFPPDDPELAIYPLEIILFHMGGTLVGLMLQGSIGLLLHKILAKYHAPLAMYAIVGAMVCFMGWIALTGVWIDPFAWWLAGFGFIQASLTHYFANRKYRLKGLAAISPHST